MTFSKRIVTIISIATLVLLTIQAPMGALMNSESAEDFDPLSNITVTFELLKIRSLEKEDNHLNVEEYIDRFSAPDFYVKVFINGKEFESPVWKNTRYIYDPDWKVTVDVPDDEEWVEIIIQLWDWNLGLDQKCDISGSNEDLTDDKEVTILYNIKTGHWAGDDFLEDRFINADPSGYGRLNGCDDGSIYERDLDAELWFDVYQNDYDGDGIPYWTETEVFGTNPKVDDRGRDDDGDGIPIEWEFKWGYRLGYNWYDQEYVHYWDYDPFTWENHSDLDPDDDGLDNYEEYLTSQWGSDPFRKDLFVEMDRMEAGPSGQPECIFPAESKELLYTVYNRQNVVYHLDDGSWDDTGSDMIPFIEECDFYKLIDIYNDYFLHGNDSHWRRGVFHYGVFIYGTNIGASGAAFRPDAYYITLRGHEKKSRQLLLNRDTVFASAYMHECGHTLGIHHGNTPGCDDRVGRYPWQLNWWKWIPYKSVMNYGYMYWILDYSNGSRGKNDFDDWDRLDFTYMQRGSW